MTETTCAIWGTSAQIERTTQDGVLVNSSRAGGRYLISGTAKAVLQNRDDTLRAQLTTWLVNQRRLGVECPEITSDTIHDVEKAHPLTVQERADTLLRYLSAKSGLLGTVENSMRWTTPRLRRPRTGYWLGLPPIKCLKSLHSLNIAVKKAGSSTASQSGQWGIQFMN